MVERGGLGERHIIPERMRTNRRRPVQVPPAATACPVPNWGSWRTVFQGQWVVSPLSTAVGFNFVAPCPVMMTAWRACRARRIQYVVQQGRPASFAAPSVRLFMRCLASRHNDHVQWRQRETGVGTQIGSVVLHVQVPGKSGAFATVGPDYRRAMAGPGAGGCSAVRMGYNSTFFYYLLVAGRLRL